MINVVQCGLGSMGSLMARIALEKRDVALVGAVSREMDIPVKVWREVLTRHLPERFLSVNVKAFDLGRSV